MRALLRRAKVWITLLTLAILSLLLFLPIKNVLDVTAVQNAVQRDWEIDFFDASRLPNGMPAMLPDRLNDVAWNYLLEKFHYVPETSGDTPAKLHYRNVVYHERFKAFFRGPIEEINVYYFEAFHGDLGAAFARFPHLRRVTVVDNKDTLPTEAEWTKLCTRLRALPNLESIELGGAWITDTALGPLAGHPHLRSLTITFGRHTEACVKTFATLPHLTTFHFGNQYSEAETPLTPEMKAAIIAALPGVTVEFPDPPATEEAPPTDPQ